MSEQSETASLDNLLDGNSSAPKAETPAERVETAPEPESTGDKQDAAPPAESDESDSSPLIPRKALIDERRKRQEIEKKFAEFEAKLAEQSKPQPQPQRQPEPRPDPWTDPVGFAEWQDRQYAIRDYETRVLLSEELYAEKPDYNDAKRAFIEAANADPSLAQKLVRHPVPAKFVYQEGKRLAALREIGPDPAAWREQERQRLRDELMAELQAQQPSQQFTAPKAPAPKSLAGTTSSVPRDQHGRYAPRNGPASLDEILGG